MSKKLDFVLAEVLEKINPSPLEFVEMERALQKFLKRIRKRIEFLKIDAEVFVGGSYAKRTLIKKQKYDLDLFLRFSKKYSEKELEKLARRILRFVRGVKVVHGSRNYFRVRGGSFFFFEVVPVRRIKKHEEFRNITDLSYFHVNYVNKKVKGQTVLNSIRLAKAFCYANGVYGAESYVRGFSGYALELLVYYFGSFEKFLRVLAKTQKKKLIVDIERFYKKENVTLELNSSKLDSPVILIDPTYKFRNVAAALSDETFAKFQKVATAFLKNPSTDFFVPKKIDFEKEKEEAEKKGSEFLELKLKTKKQAGDVAGTKLLKFFNHFVEEAERYFEVEKKNFEYGGKKAARSFLVLKRRKKIVFDGPKVSDKKNVTKFRHEHAVIHEKCGWLYAEIKVDFDAYEFLKNWKRKNLKKIKEMSIAKFGV